MCLVCHTDNENQVEHQPAVDHGDGNPDCRRKVAGNWICIDCGE